MTQEEYVEKTMAVMRNVGVEHWDENPSAVVKALSLDILEYVVDVELREEKVEKGRHTVVEWDKDWKELCKLEYMERMLLLE